VVISLQTLLPQTHRTRNEAMYAMWDQIATARRVHTSRKTLSDIQTLVEICKMVRRLLIRTRYIISYSAVDGNNMERVSTNA
jgi:hypothetical protein